MRVAEYKVTQFHETFDIHIGMLDNPKIAFGELRVSLLEEEVREFKEAIAKNNLLESVDALCDIIYVALGAAVTFGIELEPFFNEVHRSNMAKAGGYKRADGKWMKPEGWKPPDLESVLKKQVDSLNKYF